MLEIGMLHLYLARHGQTDWNAERRLQGGTDIPLNETGRQQARALAEKMKSFPIAQIYCSDLLRSRETAEIISGGAIPIGRIPELNEQSMGIFEGKFMDGRDPQGLQEYRSRASNPEDSLDGGESASQHRSRVQKALQKIRQANSAGHILVVGHGGTNRVMLRILGVSDPVLQDNADVYVIQLDS